MMFAIRDDDACFHTRPEALDEAYRGAFERGAPVSFALVPFSTTSPQTLTCDPLEEWPLGDNAALVDWLRRRVTEGLASIMQHGCTHRDRHGGPEFADGGDHGELVRRGRAHLESALGARVRVFVPPHNALGASGLRAVKAAGLHLLGGFSLGPRLRGFEPAALPAWLARRRYQRRHRTFFYPHPIELAGARELACCSLTPSTPPGEAERLLRLAHETGGRFCVAAHASELSPGLRSRLDGLLDEAARLDARFVAAEQLFD